MVFCCAAQKPSIQTMEDLDIAIHSWDINPEHIEICRRPDGRPWILGSGRHTSAIDPRLPGTLII